MPSDLLKEICDYKRQVVAERKKKISEQTLLQKISSLEKPRGFFEQLQDKKSRNETGLIAEIKKASPSAGLIRENFNPAEIATAYQAGGATCLSILTDEKYFQGRDEYIAIAKKAVQLPVLRKDFMVDPYQVIEARAIGADCILIIMAALTDAEATELESTAIEHNLDALIEVHDEEELTRALKLKSKLIGINNRNLKTLKIDLNVTRKLSKLVPEGYLLVSESGIKNYSDIKGMNEAGINSFLVGESLMKQPDIKQATLALLGKA